MCVCVGKLYVGKLCVSKLCVCVGKWVSCMWVSCAWVSCVCVWVSGCVGKSAGGRRRRRRTRTGVQNQKQEPHTKMWGTINKCYFNISALLKDFKGRPYQNGTYILKNSEQ